MGRTRSSRRRLMLSTLSFVLATLFFALCLPVTQSVESSAGAQSTKYKTPGTHRWRPTLPGNRYGDDPSLVSTATIEGRLAVFDDVWETIQSRYYDPALNGINWQAKRNAFRPAAAKAASAYELYDVLRQMIASLKDAHTRVYSPDEKFDWWNPRYVTVGLTIREIEGVPLVVHVESGSAAARTEIRPGDTIVSIDDVPAAEFISNRLDRKSTRLNSSHSQIS